MCCPACSDALRRGHKYIKISLDDIRDYDAQLAHDMADDPAEYLPLVSSSPGISSQGGPQVVAAVLS